VWLIANGAKPMTRTLVERGERDELQELTPSALYPESVNPLVLSVVCHNVVNDQVLA
jgi:hypothetical protein